MHRRRNSLVALAVTAALALTACGGGDDDGGGSAGSGSGEPVAGGTAAIGMVSEPRTLDPAYLSNNLTTNSLVGNALYGALVTNDPVTGEVSPSMAESVETTDGGTTYRLVLQEGLTFSDGTPLDAAAVQANWDRDRSIELRAPVIAVAINIRTTTVVDPRTLEFTLNTPTLAFDQTVATSALNWIASPAALEGDQASFDAAPIGGGPFVLESWSRGGAMELVRNDAYWDAPKPYLDGLTLTAQNDAQQRFNTLQSDQVDAILNNSPVITQRAEEAGITVAVPSRPNGGSTVVFQTQVAPFDDPRAREAVYKAIDLDVVQSAVFNGEGTVPLSLFGEDSPFYTGEYLSGADPERAQELFDELADEGSPVEFTMVTFPTTESLAVAQSMQSQLAAFDNVTMEIDNRDFAGAQGALTGGQFQASIAGLQFVDPEPQLYSGLYSTSFLNFSKISDPEIDEALDAARVATDDEARVQLYRSVEERVAELYPFIIWSATRENVLGDLQGVGLYGTGSVLLDGAWLAP
ncbi:ABC transporter substrate-binding protein [Trujillonella endophytica]|uniref:Peptide/nickel transport system substrate-binding protein n=1 Tax=Trujillonella endophytica TaxID=673521 RepID=A0A1H8VXV3_9ACTN|nr:ABC transporter substrate-binding protein [Trujillella endophytica]SEP20221.1 peptide/nickel transport system substrate-binding protein [Trujillella endophytica]